VVSDVGVVVWDRLLDCDHMLPAGSHLLGRFGFVAGDRRLVLGRATVRPGEYLAAPGSWTLRDDDRKKRSDGSCDVHALPDGLMARTIHALGSRLDRLIDQDASYERWLEETPLAIRTDLENQLRRRALDGEVDRHFGALRDVCHRPASRLRIVNRLVPVGAARRIIPATIVRLASHSEDWNRLRPDGVEPMTVLAPSREVHLDFYENRIAARLVDLLWHDVSECLDAVRQIDMSLGDVRRYLAEAADSPWRMRRKLYNLISPLADDALPVLAADRMAELIKLRDALFALLSTDILPGVDRHAQIGTVLRATNLFVNENRYRKVGDLWQAWVRHKRSNADGTDADQIRSVQEWCRRFAAYTGLLIVHALDHLGLGSSEQLPVRSGRPMHLGHGRELAWHATDVFVLSVDSAPVLRIVPLPHALTAGNRSHAAIGQDFEQLSVNGAAIPTLIVYPGTQEERAALPASFHLLSFSGMDAPVRGDACRLLPVSPLEIDSVTRLARSLRSVLERERSKTYPVVLSCSRVHATAAKGDSDWLSIGPGVLTVTCPPSPSEAAAARSRLLEVRKRALGRPDQRGDVERIDSLLAGLEAAADQLRALTECPICGAAPSSPWRVLRVRKADTYACECESCRTRWETRRCGSCTRAYPVTAPNPASQRLAVGPADPSQQTESDELLYGDRIDRTYGADITTAPCWIRRSVAICPECGQCGERATDKASNCHRCTTLAP
jgi:hypothetical protein